LKITGRVPSGQLIIKLSPAEQTPFSMAFLIAYHALGQKSEGILYKSRLNELPVANRRHGPDSGSHK